MPNCVNVSSSTTRTRNPSWIKGFCFHQDAVHYSVSRCLKWDFFATESLINELVRTKTLHGWKRHEQSGVLTWWWRVWCRPPRWSYPFFAPAVRREIINWHFDALPFLQLSENVDQQLKVEGVGVVKVILVLGCKLLLFCVQHLPHKDTADSRCWEKNLLSSIRRVREKNMHTSTTAASLSPALIGWFGQMARLLRASGLRE